MLDTDLQDREVTEEEAAEFAQMNGLIWLGETSCKSDINNCNDVFRALLEKVHLTQVDLVRRGYKYMEDLQFGEEERNVTYNRCCY